MREQTVVTLREALLNEVLKPGDKLAERKLAEQTGVSRTSIREALSQLESEGLVTRIAGKGMFVTRLSEQEIRQIYEARAILESAMTRMFVERASLGQMDELAARISEAGKTDTAELARQHAEKLDAVWEIIMQGAGNDITRQMTFLLRARVTYLRTITTRVASAERRRNTMALLNGIFDALRARDADLAEKLTREYVERSAAFALSLLRDSGQKPKSSPRKQKIDK
ncbi:GntR family transcriptional regulator [Mesorhizobium sp. Primo-A]|uniref:GntR family transcriptional regulator n=1 Tax=Mesorhizobium sp. Primo-A TaxID=2496780 RepID=UPI000FCA81B7|nr:GntR family transcriptional regulator [Mesorhizobium sp. Primo-A]RUU34303.1 GntR family transcriptional regulator [Mesorhizobium sp. Primo-A]